MREDDRIAKGGRLKRTLKAGLLDTDFCGMTGEKNGCGVTFEWDA